MWQERPPVKHSVPKSKAVVHCFSKRQKVKFDGCKEHQMEASFIHRIIVKFISSGQISFLPVPDVPVNLLFFSHLKRFRFHPRCHCTLDSAPLHTPTAATCTALVAPTCNATHAVSTAAAVTQSPRTFAICPGLALPPCPLVCAI